MGRDLEQAVVGLQQQHVEDLLLQQAQADRVYIGHVLGRQLVPQRIQDRWHRAINACDVLLKSAYSLCRCLF